MEELCQDLLRHIKSGSFTEDSSCLSIKCDKGAFKAVKLKRFALLPVCETGDIVISEEMGYQEYLSFLEDNITARRVIPPARHSLRTKNSQVELDIVSDVFARFFCKVPLLEDGELKREIGLEERRFQIRQPLCVILDAETVYCVEKESENATVEKQEVTLWECLNFSPAVLGRNEEKLRFVAFQILSILSDITRTHMRASAVLMPRNLSPHSFCIDQNAWVSLDLAMLLLKEQDCCDAKEDVAVANEDDYEAKEVWSWVEFCKRPMHEAVSAWLAGRLSNLDYLLTLNHFAGRVSGQAQNHPIVPWVCDFSLSEGGWRNLKQTKYRLNKGDRQLDQSFQQICGTLTDESGEVPHHLPEILSDLSYFVYRARVTPKSVLCEVVRSQWVPEEYPASIRRLYEWTPDEAIPEFYTEPSIFRSQHEDMTDLALPMWSNSAEEFIAWHRGMLECDWVSQRLHHWIDLVFGYKLSGMASVDAKNVHLSLVDSHQRLLAGGYLQLFSRPHPQKLCEAPRDGFLNVDEAFNLIMKPLYDMEEEPWEVFETTSEAFDLASTYAFIRNRPSMNQHRSRGLVASLESFGVLLLEMCFPSAFRSFPRTASSGEKLSKARRLLSSRYINIPRSLRKPCEFLLSGLDNSELSLCYSILKQPLCDVFNFPHSFHLLHDSLVGIALSSESAEVKIRVLSRNLPAFLPVLDIEMAKVLTGALTAMFKDPLSRVLVLWSLFNPLSQRLGPACAKHLFLPLLKSAYDVETQWTPKFLKLYHRSFLLQLSVRLGFRTFLQEIVPLLVEAASGERDPLLCTENSFALQMRHEEGRKWLDTVEEPADCPSVQFALDLEEVKEASVAGVVYSPREDDEDCPEDETEEDEEDEEEPFFEPEESSAVETEKISTVARESLLWLAQRLGPVLTARHITRDLMRMVGLCFNTRKSEEADGDLKASITVKALLDVCGVYGDAFILLQCIPYCVDVVQQATRRLSRTTESNLVGCMEIVKSLLPYLGDKQLMDNLQETIVDAIAFPTIRLLSSIRLVFSRVEQRRLLADKLSLLLHIIGLRIGPENLKRFMSAPLQRLLCTYDLLYVLKGTDVKLRTETPEITSQEVKAQLECVFTPDFASKLYHRLSGLCGRRYFQLSLPNSELIMKLVQAGSRSGKSGRERSDSLMDELSAGSLLGSNRLSSSHPDRSSVEEVPSKQQLPHSFRALSGNWLAYWEQELGRSERGQELLKLDQMKLMSFVGHSGPVRQLYSMENENSFVSGSQDKTIKLWSIRSFGDGRGRMEAQWTYKGHKKSIQDLIHVDSLRLIVSSDGIVHIWDPFLGTTLREFEWTNGNASVGSDVQFMTSFESPSSTILTASSEPLLRFLDVRLGKWAHEFKISPTTVGGIKCLIADPKGCYAAVGHAGGHVSVLDLRTGRSILCKKISDADITTMHACGDKTFALFAGDSQPSIWNFFDGKLKAKLPGGMENPCSIATYWSQLACTGGSNRFRMYNTRTAEAQSVDSKLRSEVLNGTVSSLKILEENRLFLFGLNSGSIDLLS